MARQKLPVTAAIRVLREHGVAWTDHPYAYEERGGTSVSARELGVKSVQSCAPAVADRHSGYQVGGTSPFGTQRAMPVYLERSIAELPYLYVNGGRRGYLVGMTPAELIRVLRPTLVDVAIDA